MKRLCFIVVFAGGAFACAMLQAQGRGGVEWTTSGFDAQRSGAVRNDPRISLQTMQSAGEFGPFKFLWQLKLEHDPKAARVSRSPSCSIA